MLNKAMKLMDQRQAMINEAKEVLVVLGAEDAPVAPIAIKRGHIVEVQTVKEVVIDNTDYETIKRLTAENKELKEELAALKQTKDNTNNVKGVDAMDQPKEQPKKNNSPLFGRLMNALEEEEQPKEETVVEETNEVVVETNEIEMTYERYDTPEAIAKGIPKYADIMIGVNGTDITINDKSYKFKARREFHMPIIYGCFDEEVVRIAREEITKIHRFRLSEERTTNDPNFKYAQDKEYPIVVWRLTDDNGHVQYHGYARTTLDQLLVLAWEKDDKKKSTNVARMFAKNLFTDKENWRTLRDNKVLADKFMAICKDIWPEDFTNDNNDPKLTKAVKHITKEQQSITKEAPQDTNEIVVNVTNDDPTAGSEDLDI